MKTVATYQYNAIKATSADGTFAFPRIYKNATQKVVLTVASISSSSLYAESDYKHPAPVALFLSGYSQINGKANTNTTTGGQDNRFYLGTTTGGGGDAPPHTFAPPRLILDELPLTPFKIEATHWDDSIEVQSGKTKPTIQYLISFNIDVVDC